MFKKLLVPIDGGELSHHAIRQGLDLARQLGASVQGFVVEALPALPTMGTHMPSYQRDVMQHEAATRDHAQRLLKEFSAAAADAGVDFDGVYERNDDIAGAIAAIADRQACDMIVMATHGRGAFGGLLFGSQTRRVMSLSKVPLLVLH